jgi:hypothetical protein
MLLGRERWSALRGAFLDRRSLPASAQPYLERVLAQLNAGLQAVDGETHFSWELLGRRPRVSRPADCTTGLS